MSHWNHRIIKRNYPNEDYPTAPKATIYGVFEVYYDDKGLMHSCSIEPVVIIGDSVEEAKDTLGLIIKAFRKPVINYDDIPEKGAQTPEAASSVEEALDMMGTKISPEDAENIKRILLEHIESIKKGEKGHPNVINLNGFNEPAIPALDDTPLDGGGGDPYLGELLADWTFGRPKKDESEDKDSNE